METPLSAALRRLRVERNLSQQKVADAVGVKRPTVAQWESGRFPPSADKVHLLDATLEAGGELVDLAGLSSEDVAAPVRDVAGSTPGATLERVFRAVGDRLVGAVLTDPDDPECVGWTQAIDDVRPRPTPWSTALAVRALLLLDRADVDIRSVARTMGRRQHAGGWSNRDLDVPRPDVTAVVLSTLTRIGRGNAADLDGAWEWLTTSLDRRDQHRTFVLSTVLENVAQLRPGHPFVGDLVRLLLDARMDVGGRQVWAAYAAVDRSLVEPSVAHTAQAVVALRTASASGDWPEAEDAVGQAVAWLVDTPRDDGFTEIHRVDPERPGLDVPVGHFTAAHVVRALVGQPGVPRARLESALATLWDPYVPAEGLWVWKQDGSLPIWMSHAAISALRAAALAGFPVPREAVPQEVQSGALDAEPGGGPARPPDREGR